MNHDYDKGVAFINVATVSTTYALLSRCGLAADAHLDPEEFMPVFDFNTPQTVFALGSAVSEISEKVLRSIEVTIKKYERENSIMVRPDLNATAKERIKGMLVLSTCVHELIDLQMDETIPDSAIQEKQAELNRLYDSFTEKYGLINSRGNKLALPNRKNSGTG